MDTEYKKIIYDIISNSGENLYDIPTFIRSYMNKKTRSIEEVHTIYMKVSDHYTSKIEHGQVMLEKFFEDFKGSDETAYFYDEDFIRNGSLYKEDGVLIKSSYSGQSDNRVDTINKVIYEDIVKRTMEIREWDKICYRWGLVKERVEDIFKSLVYDKLHNLKYIDKNYPKFRNNVLLCNCYIKINGKNYVVIPDRTNILIQPIVEVDI